MIDILLSDIHAAMRQVDLSKKLTVKVKTEGPVIFVRLLDSAGNCVGGCDFVTTRIQSQEQLQDALAQKLAQLEVSIPKRGVIR